MILYFCYEKGETRCLFIILRKLDYTQSCRLDSRKRKLKENFIWNISQFYQIFFRRDACSLFYTIHLQLNIIYRL